MFHILREQEQHLSPPEQHFSTEVRLTLNARRRSLDRSSKPGRCMGSSILLGEKCL